VDIDIAHMDNDVVTLNNYYIAGAHSVWSHHLESDVQYLRYVCAVMCKKIEESRPLCGKIVMSGVNISDLLE